MEQEENGQSLCLEDEYLCSAFLKHFPSMPPPPAPRYSGKNILRKEGKNVFGYIFPRTNYIVEEEVLHKFLDTAQ